MGRLIQAERAGPFPWVTYLEIAAFINYLATLSGVYFILKAYRQKREAALFFLVLLGASLAVRRCDPGRTDRSVPQLRGASFYSPYIRGPALR